MAFSQMLDLLKQKEKGTIVFIKLGTFYIATGEDAVLLHNKLELKCTCFKMNICKIGFPVNSLEEYVNKRYEKTDKYVLAVNKMFEKELKYRGILK